MKTITIREAIELGLLRETKSGLGLNGISQFKEDELETATIEEIKKEMSEPFTFVSDDGKQILYSSMKEGKMSYACPRVFTPDNTPVMVYASFKGMGYSYIQDNDNLDISDDKWEHIIDKANGKVMYLNRYYDDKKMNTNQNGDNIELENPIELNFEDNVLTINLNGNSVVITPEYYDILNIYGDNFTDIESHIVMSDGRISNLFYGGNPIKCERYDESYKEKRDSELMRNMKDVKIIGKNIVPRLIELNDLSKSYHPIDITVVEPEELENHNISEVLETISDRKPEDINKVVSEIAAEIKDKSKDNEQTIDN